MSCDDGILRFFQHTIQAAENRQRDHHPAILRRAIRATQKIRNGPNDITVLLVLIEVLHEVMLLFSARASMSNGNAGSYLACFSFDCLSNSTQHSQSSPTSARMDLATE